MIRRPLIKTALAVGAAGVLLALAGCSTPAGSSSDTSSSSSVKGTVKVAFFGFAASNSFAQASFKGIQTYAGAHDATAKFFDGNFDASTQVQQIQDATTSGDYDVFIVQANDGAAVIPAVQQAIAAGITVVGEFTPVGTTYDTAKSQVKGMYYVGDVPSENGAALASMAVSACSGISPCTVAYLQGNPALPLDNTRTKAVVNGITSADSSIEVISSYQGGYTQDAGRKVGQDLLTAHPDVNVIIGSSQALLGVQSILPKGSKIKLIGNGSSTQAIDAVKSGAWYGTYVVPEVKAAALAAQVGIGAARGQKESSSIDTGKESFSVRIGTADALKDVTGDYSD